jgi:hypothetical protein
MVGIIGYHAGQLGENGKYWQAFLGGGLGSPRPNENTMATAARAPGSIEPQGKESDPSPPHLSIRKDLPPPHGQGSPAQKEAAWMDR